MMNTKPTTKEALNRAIGLTGDALRSAETRRSYLRALGAFETWLLEHADDTPDLPPISYDLVTQYMRHLERSGKSVSVRIQALAAIKKLCMIFRNQGRLDLYVYTIIKGIEPDKSVPHLKGQFIPESDIDQMLQTCRTDETPAGLRDGSIISLLHCTGMRRGECVALTVGDLDLEPRRIIIRNPKNKKDRSAFFNEGAEHYLKDWLAVRGPSDGPLYWRIKKGGNLCYGIGISAQAIYHILAKRCKKAKLETTYAPHDLRRTLISNLLNQDIDLPLVSRIVGHSSPVVTAKYDKRPEEEMKRAVNKIYTPFA